MLTELALGVLVVLPLLRRRAPIAAILAWAGVVIALTVLGAGPYDMTTAFVGLLVYPYGAGAYGEGRRVLLAIPAVWGAMSVMALSAEEFIAGDIIFPSIFGTLFLIAGRVVRSRSRLTAELHEAAVRAAEAREAESERAVADERRRIAREMHDVVAHSVSMMVVQAGGARRILERDPARAVAAAELIERTGREALAEMRALLGVLHADEHSEYAPQPTLRELEALVERARSAGVPVTLELVGRAPRAARRARSRRLSRRAGGADERRQALERRADHGVGALPCRCCGGLDRRSRQRPPGRAARQRRPRPRRHARARADVRRRAARRAPARRRLRGARGVPARGRGSGGADGRSAGMNTVRVLIADDQALVRAGFKMILDAEDDLDVIGEAADGLEAVELARRLKPDVVLMDIRMPQLDGIEATRRVVALDGAAPVRVLMLTTFDLNEYVYEALRAGASGFLLKDVPPEQLAAGIRIIAQGEALLAPSITKRLISEFASAAPAAAKPPKGLDELTARELEVFKLIARGLSNARSPPS